MKEYPKDIYVRLCDVMDTIDRVNKETDEACNETKEHNDGFSAQTIALEVSKLPKYRRSGQIIFKMEDK